MKYNLAEKAEHTDKLPSSTPFDFGSHENSSTTTQQPITSTAMSTTAGPSALSGAYALCKQGKRLCFGVNSQGSKCIESNDCTILFSCQSISKTDGTVQIELFWSRSSSSSDNWAAVALSDDQKMGSDSVTECILKSDGSVVLRSGWNPGEHSPTVNVNDSSTTSLKTSHQNGVVYCFWSRRGLSSIEGHEFDIKNTSYYVILAHGAMEQGSLKL